MRWLLCLVLVAAGVTLDAAEHPNIVYIIADDQSWPDFGLMGNERVHTPNLDQLASRSVVFENGYLTTSVCRPSLVTLMTGLYPHQHGVYFNHGPPGNSAYNRMTSRQEYEKHRSREFELIQKVDTLPRLLSEELGYRCLQTGKFWEGHWKNGGFTEGMTTFEPPPPEQTFGGVRKLASGERVAHGNGDLGLQIGRMTMDPIKEFILDCEEGGQPWLVWYAPYLPHQPHDSPERFYELARSMPDVKEHEVPYFASIAQFDETVGELIEFVEVNSSAENTIFVFVSDNGWSPGTKPQKGREQEFAHTKRSKRAPFDEGVRSPILIRWDGKVTPARRNELVSSIDIVPTLLNAVGLETKGFPGEDLLGEFDESRAVFGAIYPGDASASLDPDDDVAYRWVRQGEYKLIVPASENAWGDYLSHPALYRISVDPDESLNRIADEGQRDRLFQLQGELNRWWPSKEVKAMRAAQNIASVCASASAAGLNFVKMGGGNLEQVVAVIVKGSKIEDEESPFDGVYFGTPQHKGDDLSAILEFLTIEAGQLLYRP